jgi:hypothetical protein
MSHATLRQGRLSFAFEDDNHRVQHQRHFWLVCQPRRDPTCAETDLPYIGSLTQVPCALELFAQHLELCMRGLTAHQRTTVGRQVYALPCENSYPFYLHEDFHPHKGLGWTLPAVVIRLNISGHETRAETQMPCRLHQQDR